MTTFHSCFVFVIFKLLFVFIFKYLLQLTSEVDQLRQSVDTNESDVNANILKLQQEIHAYEEKLSNKTKLIEQVFFVFIFTLK